MAKRRRRVIGLIPRAGRWLAAHPQPFVLLLTLAGTLWALGSYAQRSDAFRVAQVSLPPDASLKVPPAVMGANLWTLDLARLAEELHRQQPWLKEVRVVRLLPNGIRIDPIRRMPVAQVKLERWYQVDREGVLLPDGSADGFPGLIRLTGFTRGGKPTTDERLALALRALEALRRSPVFVMRRLEELNVANPQELRLVLNGEVEVRCGSEAELAAQLQRLRAVLKMVARQQLDVQYIDLRFQEPVIGPRT